MVYEGLDFSSTACLVWPVEWLDKKRPRPDMDLHVTCVYLPNVNGLDKDSLLRALRDGGRREQGFEVARVSAPDAFGPLEDHPVLLLELDNWWERRDVEIILTRQDVAYADNYPFNPHVTVNLRTIINPPKKVLLRPLELWWKDDEPVVV